MIANNIWGDNPYAEYKIRLSFPIIYWEFPSIDVYREMMDNYYVRRLY